MGEINQEIIRKITIEVLKRLAEGNDEESIPIGVSNRHIHLSQEDLEILFGQGYKLTKLKDLKQPGQFAAEEKVTVIGPKGKFENVRILGPTRAKTQIEISLTDGFKLGIKPPVRESGKIEDTPGITIKGPKGSIQKYRGVIAALRHIHMPKEYAEKYGLEDNSMVNVVADGVRKVAFYNVLIRISEKYALEMHIDTDEANAAGLSNGDKVKIIRD
ncbi:phosphate propanoyltransferase [Wukongibacter baidiensis]|uniref:phosphate propanoyltransferase n=1 Tax=Wukongibacter baidiensis TaxID=1723361 RepID=UPI003D7F8983